MSALRNTNVSVLARVNKESTLKLQVDVTDDAGDPVVPTSFRWTLTERDGTVVNSRTSVSETPASSVVITLAGDDLQILDESNEREFRILTVSTDQADAAIPLTIEARFWVENLVAVPIPIP